MSIKQKNFGLLFVLGVCLATGGFYFASFLKEPTKDNVIAAGIATPSDNPDENFVKEAAEGGLFEEKIGWYAASHATTKEGKVLGQVIYDDHSKSNAELLKLAEQKAILIDMKELSDKNQGTYNDLIKRTGIDFDKEYADKMVKDHKKDIEKFEDESVKGKDADIRDWASKKLDVLKRHLKLAEDTQESLKNAEKNISSNQ